MRAKPETQDFTIFSVTTSEGFHDDVFEDYGATALALRFTVLF